MPLPDTADSRTAKDHRSPLAKARDEYFDSGEGEIAQWPESLGAPRSQHRYLRNRLERAFLAGAEAQKRIGEKGGYS